ncbi:phage holin family protein [Nocardioides cynanchi]|uniref:phage holin family protein n=1 Tax=Nocardioides cynanchi TaxID=2558918 RepID=UPI0012445F3C|nr:phage holin family protein [Nocardioides cynanchi]
MSTTTSGASGSPSGPSGDPTLGALVHDLTQQVPELIRSELRLAQAEMTEKGKRAGIGIGMFSAAGLLALFGLACVVATAVLALAHALPDWLSALVVGAVLFVAAGAIALVGKREVQQATPPAPEQAIEGVKEDIAVVKGARS